MIAARSTARSLVQADDSLDWLLAYRAPEIAGARELYELCFGLLALSGVPTALALGAYGATVLRARPLPSLTGWVALVGAASHVLIAGSFLPTAGFFSLEGGVIGAVPVTLFTWLLVTSRGGSCPGECEAASRAARLGVRALGQCGRVDRGQI